MPAKPVQVSIERELLAQIDRDPRTKAQGRSAFIRDAVKLYLATRRRDVDRQIAAAYRGKADDLLADTEGWRKEQAGPAVRPVMRPDAR